MIQAPRKLLMQLHVSNLCNIFRTVFFVIYVRLFCTTDKTIPFYVCDYCAKCYHSFLFFEATV
jgi:hypothetical protein